jgi:hypothetical protein
MIGSIAVRASLIWRREKVGLTNLPITHAFMQTSLAEPVAGVVPFKQLETVKSAITKGIGGAIVMASGPVRLNLGCKTVDAQTHIHGLEDQPDLSRGLHQRISESSRASQVGPTVSGICSSQPLACYGRFSDDREHQCEGISL